MSSGTPLAQLQRNERRTRKVLKLFMEFLHSSLDHPVSQQCSIYQLEEIRIKAGETPDELIE